MRAGDAPMKAVIMAGGEGTRLRPLTSNQPKPMLPLANRPMMEHVVALLRSHGFEEVVVTVAFMANAIRNYFGDGSEFGVQMAYATEPTPLGTAGSILNAREQLEERFLVISGDVLTDMDLTATVRAHEESGALGTIALKSVDDPLEFGIVITTPDGSIDRFLEKPTWGQVFSDTINTGIYVLEPEIFDFIEAGKPVDFSADVFPAVLAAGKPLSRPHLGRVLGGRRDARGVPGCPPGRHGRKGAGRRSGVPASTRRLARQGRRGRPRCADRRSGDHRRQRPRRAGNAPGLSLRPRTEHPDRRQLLDHHGRSSTRTASSGRG